MRKLVLIAVIPLLSCNFTKQQKAEHLVKKYLDSTLNDPHSYESVKFEKLDSINSDYTFSDQYYDLNKSIESNSGSMMTEKMNFDYPDLYSRKKTKLNIARLLKDSTALAKKMSTLKETFQPKFLGWQITHTYRAKNGFGALGLHQTLFRLDSNLTQINNIDNLDK